VPELPEVETIARVLSEDAAGRTITSVEVRRARSVGTEPPALSLDDFVRELPGRTIVRAWRRGKVLLLDLVAEGRPPLVLAAHLRMTGALRFANPGEEPGKHTHIVLGLDQGPPLFFDDPRTFGSLRAIPADLLGAWAFWNKLGPEPLEISAADFAALMAGRKSRVKALLLDQTVIAGVGNIYADEACFRSGIRPDATAADVSPARLKRLHAALAEVLREAIAANGSSIRDYKDARGRAGAFQNSFRAYGRWGRPCLNCGTPMTRTTVAGRTTTYCPKCQK